MVFLTEALVCGFGKFYKKISIDLLLITINFKYLTLRLSIIKLAWLLRNKRILQKSMQG